MYSCSNVVHCIVAFLRIRLRLLFLTHFSVKNTSCCVTYDFSNMLLFLIGSCSDKNSNCGNWRKFCTDSRYDKFMTANCPKTCGRCGGGGGGMQQSLLSLSNIVMDFSSLRFRCKLTLESKLEFEIALILAFSLHL